MRTSRIITAVLIAATLVVAACTSSSTPTNSTPPPNGSGPTGFITSNLILPDLGASAGNADITVTVTNYGIAEASHELSLVLDGVVAGTQTVVLAGGASQIVSFSVVLNNAGTHTVTIGQVTGKLEWPGPN